MVKVGTLFWLVLVSATGFAMFGVKYQVQALEDELARTKRATTAEEHEIRVLDAEWAYLTRPETLEAMNRQFLSLTPISTKQLHSTAADIPLRPVPPAPPPAAAPAEATTVVAAAEPTPPSNAPSNAVASAPEGVPSRNPAPVPVKVAAEPQTAQSALRVMPAVLERSAGTPQLAKAVAVKAVVKPTAPRRAKSLDDLISQIMASR
jgi:hypothetical protein